MSFEIEGKLFRKFDTESKSSNFQARDFVIEIQDGNYPQMIKFQLTQDRCALIDEYAEGEPIKVHFDLRGREWQGRFFTNLNAWRLEKVGGNEGPQKAGVSSEATDFPSADDEPPTGMDTDDLPF
jgi:single-strand DNA-binding protein